MQYNTNQHTNNEPVTACIYDELQFGVWLVFTKNEPEFMANIDKCGYHKILDYIATCSSMRQHIYTYFDALKANSTTQKYYR